MFCAPCLADVAEEDLLTHLVIEHIDKMERRLMTAIGDVQGQLDQLGQQLTDLAATLTTDASTIETEIAAGSNATINLDAINNGVAAVQTAAAALGAIANPTPAPAP